MNQSRGGLPGHSHGITKECQIKRSKSATALEISQKRGREVEQRGSRVKRQEAIESHIAKTKNHRGN